MLVPGLAGRAVGHAGDVLTATRQVFIGFVGALVLFQVVLVFIGTDPAIEPSATFALVLLAVGVVNVFVVSPSLVRKQPLDGSSPGKLLATYRTRFFLQVAFAESAALFGFVAFFVANEWWVYPASLVSAFTGFARLAPTRANLAKDQASLRSSGSNLSLVRVLRGLDAP
jgi:hypothetical protein